MKAPLIVSLLFALVTVSAPAEVPIFKQFESGAQGNGFLWDYCHEGERLYYVVFSYASRPRALGETREERYVKVSSAGSRHPKATLYYGPKSQRDLFAADDQIYQVERNGEIRAFEERVSHAELKKFMRSHSQEVTAEALLKYVQSQRVAKE